MGYVYRYTDLSDGVIKYVGIVWKKNRTLRQRVREHSKNDSWCIGKNWKIEYLESDIVTRNDAEYFEAHYIELYKTYQYYNKGKAGWGLGRFVPYREHEWKLYDDIDEQLRSSENVEHSSERKEIFRAINTLNTKVNSLQAQISEDYINDNSKSDVENIYPITKSKNKKTLGRSNPNDWFVFKKLRDQRCTISDISAMTGFSESTVKRGIKRIENNLI